ncbi:hypothetical protein BASA81_006527 [Batrachochytrium salamandrivorans]|nr:hypothetical protein BASA81_006527 [Batrachochytrium salamandrivorans]
MRRRSTKRVSAGATKPAPQPAQAVSKKSNYDNNDLCHQCKLGEGVLFLCDFPACPLAFHASCLQAGQLPNPKRPNDLWVCPSHGALPTSCFPVPTNDKKKKHCARLLLEPDRLLTPSSLGAKQTVGKLMQWLELAVEDPVKFCALVAKVIKFYFDCAQRGGGLTSIEVCELMLLLTQEVGQSTMETALIGLQEGKAKVSQGLINMGLDQGCVHCQCSYRVLRTCCLQCGEMAVPTLVLIPSPLLNITEPPVMHLRLAAARRGLVHFEQVCNQVRDEEFGDVTFLSYKLWTAMRSTELELEAKLVCQRVVDKFCQVKSTQGVFPTNCMAELLDTCEGLHVVQRLLTRQQLLHHPQLTNIDQAQKLVNRMVAQIKPRLLEFHLSDVCGFDPGLGSPPLTPKLHCSNCSKENLKHATTCSSCSHRLLSKYDYGSMTDAIVWSFVFGSIGLGIECHSSSANRLGQLRVEDVLFLLPETRNYRELDELGESFFKLQCYFITHFIYVMSDWGEHGLVRQFYEEEYQFIVRNLGYVLGLQTPDPEIVGEFIHCLYILGYEFEKNLVLDNLINTSVEFLLREEAQVFGKRGAWTSNGSVLYAKYHASWCGIVGLLPRMLQSKSISCAQALVTAHPSRFV